MKYIKYATLAAVLVLIVALVVIYAPSKVKAMPSSINRAYLADGGNGMTLTRPATTTSKVFLTTSSASTTFPFNTGGADMVRISYLQVASTTATKPVFAVQTTNDNKNCDTDPNTCDWFTDYGTVTGSATLATTTYVGNTGTNATSTGTFLIPTANSRYMRVLTSLVGANGSIWMEAAVKLQNNY